MKYAKSIQCWHEDAETPILEQRTTHLEFEDDDEMNEKAQEYRIGRVYFGVLLVATKLLI